MPLKRTVDIFLSLLGLIVLAPVLLAVAIAVRIKLGRPVFFTQRRPGLHGKIFRLVKFRSMLVAKDLRDDPSSDAVRLTGFGNLLRSTSLDELPSLWNVLKGDMSVVGPRPLLEQYLKLYSPEQARRHDVRPGLTGWAQINGRNSLSWDEKFALDLWYVENQSFWLDCRIIFRTLRKVIDRDGINAAEDAPMPPFEGNS